MTHATRFVAVVVLAALVLCVPVQAQTPEFGHFPQPRHDLVPTRGT
jgi:hypothetical protein